MVQQEQVVPEGCSAAAWGAYQRFLAIVQSDWANGWVYFITDGLGNVKIGKSRSPRRRLSSLRSASAQPLNLIGVIHGYSLVEEAVHAILKSAHVQGEWFRDCELLRNFMALHCKTRDLALCLLETGR